MNRLKLLIIVLASAMLFNSCTKDPEITKVITTVAPDTTKGSVMLRFTNMVGDSALVLNNAKSYINANNDTFSVNLFRYYISNIKLIRRSDGFVFAEPNSFHLLDATDISSLIFSLSNVPFGTYDSVSMMIGVDGRNNTSGAQTGALDPANGMFWSWNSGYIMAKLGGISPQSTANNHGFTYHIGGFSGAYNAVKVIAPACNGHVANVSSLVTPEIYLKADVLEWFKTPNLISLATINDVATVGQVSKSIADNYADMITITNIHN